FRGRLLEGAARGKFSQETQANRPGDAAFKYTWRSVATAQALRTSLLNRAHSAAGADRLGSAARECPPKNLFPEPAKLPNAYQGTLTPLGGNPEKLEHIM